MTKFICKKDIEFLGKKIIKKDTIIEVDKEILLETDDKSLSMKMTIEEILKNELFEEIKDDYLKMSIKEVSGDEESIVKEWILQLKVTTTRKRLREIEKFLNQNLVDYL